MQSSLTRSAALLVLGVLVISACAPGQTKTTSASPAKEAPNAAPAPVQSIAAAPPAAAPTPASAPQATQPAVKLTAVVQSVDADGHLVVQDKHGKIHTFTVASDATITKGGDDASAALSDIKAGDHVKLKVSGDAALSVHILVLAAKAGQVAAAQ